MSARGGGVAAACVGAGRVRGHMDPRHDPDQVDPTNQSGRPLMITLVPIGLLLALGALVLVYVLSR